MRPLPNVAALARAVRMAADWRGSITGDDEAEEAFDLEAAKHRKALYNLRRHLAYHKALRELIRDIAVLDSRDVRDARRNTQLLASIIRRAQVLYP